MSSPAPDPSPAPAGSAVFLSYASQDAAVASRLCDALRAAGVEVWFDQNELVGGDAWDAKIRRQIAECALFVPVISAATQARTEGYFRLEWKLAAQRTHMIADDAAFLLPVVIDETRDAEARVPAEFKAVQWTRLPGGEKGEAFGVRVKKLLTGSAMEPGRPRPGERDSGAASPATASAKPRRRVPAAGWIIAATAALAVAGYFASRPARDAAAGTHSPATDKAISSAPQTEAQKLVAQARKIYDDGDELNRENLFLAEELVKRAIDRDPAEPAAWELATWLSYTMVWHSIDNSENRRDLLSRQASRLIALSPESIPARVVHANARLTPGWSGATTMATREKGILEVQRELTALARREPDNWQIQRALGTAHRFLSRTEESIAALTRALELSGGHPAAVGDLINVLVRRGRHAEAEAALAIGLARQRSGRLLTFDLLLKTRWRGDTAAAIASVESGAWPAWLNREDRGAFFAWQSYFWGRQPEQALAVVRGVPRDYLRDANFSGPRAVLAARAYERAGQTVAAQGDWRTVIQIADRELAANPEELSALYWKAWALARLGDTTAARAICALIQQRTRGDQPVFLRGTHLSALLATAGMSEAAVEDLRGYRTTITDGYVITRAVLTLDPAYDPLRADPRFTEILKSAPAPAETAAPAEKSIAVLPFANVGGDKDNEAFSDGITDELISVLGRVPGLTVKARTSSFFFKGSSAPARDKGQKLGAAYLVDGSVRRLGDKVRITAQLIRAATEENVWTSEPITDDTKDVFAVQEKIAGLIAQALKLKLGAASAASKAPVNPEAFELYVQARRAWNLRTDDGLARAEQLLNSSLALEPNFARAHAAMADVWSMTAQRDRTFSKVTGRLGPAVEQVEERCKLAISLDPGSSEAHASLGNFYWAVWRRAEGESELREAIRLNGSYASAHQWLGRALLLDGRIDEALIRLRQATELDPLSHRILDNYAWALIFAGRFSEAIEYCERALRLQDTAPQPRALKAVALAQTGRLSEAMMLAQMIPAGDSTYSMFRAIVFGLAGRTADLKNELSGYEKDGLISKVAGLAALGLYSEALEALDPSWIVSTRADYLLFHPIFDPMRSDARFKRAIETLGLTEAHARAQAWRAAHPPEKPAR
ncbi:MAG: TIR domain-containing protein [Opitutaceae bacterium]|nr:TIR domain-containing protein [Opitutaceae bacterium]